MAPASPGDRNILVQREQPGMSLITTSKKAVRVYRQEGGRELLRRTWLKLRERWANPPRPGHEDQTALSLAPAATSGPLQAHEVNSIDIVVCVHNALEDIKQCLQSLALCTKPNARLLLVDDGSELATAAFLQSYAERNQIRLIRNDIARGYTYAANQGLRASSADRVVLLNSDTIVTPGWLDAMLSTMSHDEKIGIVGPLSNTASWQSIPEVEVNGDWKCNAIPTGLSIESYAEALRWLMPTQHAETGFINGFCMLLKRELLDEVGLFDEKIFGAGYGEENDLCLRAHKKSWKLAVCMQAYVFHAQSKSYSDERRLALCKAADQSLNTKHGLTLKQQQLSRTKNHPLLLFGRAASQVAAPVNEALQGIRNRHAGRKLLYLLPAAHAGGGSNVVLAEAIALQAAGVDVWIANFPSNRYSFRESYSNLKLPCCYFDLDKPDELALQIKGFDAVIATHNQTAHWASNSKPTHTKLGYYIQDFEPYFYPLGSKGWLSALESYQLNAPFLRFCKTRWTADILRKEINMDCHSIGPSIDARSFAPAAIYCPQTTGRPVYIAAMIRVSCERRQPKVTATLLVKLKQRFGENVQLFSFGSRDAELHAHGISPGLAFKNLGRLNPPAVASLLKQVDLFIDASSFQAMGLTAMEALACGCAVIGPQQGGLTEVVAHDGHPLAHCVDTSSVELIFKACNYLIEDYTTRERLRKRAFEVTQYHPLLSAGRMMDLLFSDA